MILLSKTLEDRTIQYKLEFHLDDNTNEVILEVYIQSTHSTFKNRKSYRHLKHFEYNWSDNFSTYPCKIESEIRDLYKGVYAKSEKIKAFT
jgi:hypothetical protein